ncbi:type II secretion system protein [Candidatus Saccharibacteria bacterium]|nr:type II secretion system protein [Candidatus Saccharibacteria bacterium]
MKKKGFTIIEVVLVLAIAGLIFLMVFVALPNLQRTQRDTQRRNDIDRLSTMLTQYITNNRSLPEGASVIKACVGGTEGSGCLSDAGVAFTGWDKFVASYMLADGQDVFEDPSGDPYQIQLKTACDTTSGCIAEPNLSQAFSGAGIMVVQPGAKCSDNMEDGLFTAVGGKRLFGVAMKLEGGGVYCVDNS